MQIDRGDKKDHRQVKTIKAIKSSRKELQYMNVELAKTAGFCFGVKRAVDTVYEQIEKHRGEKIFTYGPIIHNEEVIKDLRSHGV